MKRIKITKYFKGIKLYVAIFTIMMIISSIISAIIPVFSANLLTNLISFNVLNIVNYIVVLVSITIISVILYYAMNIIYVKHIQKNVILNIRRDVVSNLLSMKTINFDKTSSGDFIERINNDPNDLADLFNIIQYNIFGSITYICVLIYVFYLNYMLGLVYLITLIAIAIYGNYAFKVYQEKILLNKSSEDSNSSILNEIIRSIRDIKVLNIYNTIFKRLDKSLDTVTSTKVNNENYYEGIYMVQQIIENISSLLIILLGIYLVNSKLLTITNLLVIFTYKGNIYSLISCYTTLKTYISKYKVSSSRIYEIMDENKYPKESFGNISISNIKGKIEFKNLSFGYDDKKILNDISFTIEPNDTIAIVGKSGSGKTTLLNLLDKGYDVDNNCIFIDDIDINNLTKDSIRNNISIISQNPYIFDLSIKDNLKLIDENISDNDIVKYCKIAQIDDYINTLPNKYDTLLGENGVNLSGGQKQRLAIARALVKNSKIILFDEATSALDNITQKELQTAINNISADYTIIIVAHRLSTIKSCRKIFVINDGKIVGSGTHQDLLNNNKYYQELYKSELEV